MPHVKQISVIQVGIGLIGGATIQQALAQRERWREHLGLDVVYRGMIDSSGGVCCEDPEGYSAETLRSAVDIRAGGGKVSDAAAANNLTLRSPDEVIRRVSGLGATVLLDTATGDTTAPLSAQMLSLGGAAVFSNKAPLALPLADPSAAAIWDEATSAGRVRFETTCGAGLPVISSLQSLLDTGDAVIEIVGALSGTLGAIFSDVAQGTSFSDAVRSAKQRGYTEPDPRDDLSGLDVARKALILARTIGMRADLNDVRVESLVPEHLRQVSIEDFLEQVSSSDAAITERSKQAQAGGKTLKYVATIRPGSPIEVGVRAIDRATVLGSLQGPENVISIRTSRYDDYPMTISGPGAGAAVTAAGVLADLLSLVHRQGGELS